MPDAIREEAVATLGKIGTKAKSAAPHLHKMLPNSRTTLSLRIILALGNMVGGDHKVHAALIDLWATPDQSHANQVQVALALCKLRLEAKGLVNFLIHTLAAKQESSVRQVAAEAFGWRDKNEVEVVPILLMTALQEKDEKVRLKVEASLTQLKLTRDKAIRLCPSSSRNQSMRRRPCGTAASRPCRP